MQRDTKRLGLSAFFVLAMFAFGSSPVFAYDGNGAANWADGHWNSNLGWPWPNFSDDCTNFVSQALALGGNYTMTAVTGSQADNHNWYMDAGNSRWTLSWTVAADQESFQALHNPGGYYYGSYSGTYGGNDDLYPGDELFYEWTSSSVDHMSIQVAYGTDPNSGWVGNLVDQHTTNRYHAYWTLQPYNAQASTTTIYEYHLDSGN